MSKRSELEIYKEEARCLRELLVTTAVKQHFCWESRRATLCQCDDNDYCKWEHCPQIKDNEPTKSGRHCPLDRGPTDDDE